MGKKIIFLIVAVGLSLSVYAQEKYTVSGYIKDSKTGESLIGVSVFVKELNNGTTTNPYGYYSLTLPKGDYHFIFSYIGYDPKDSVVSLFSNRTLNVEIGEQVVQINEVVVSSEKMDANVTEIKMSRENVKIDRIKSIPALLGEVDVIRSIQLLPGIQTAGEGTTGLFVRGGSADQTLILLDEAPVFNASHFLGFFSVFNPDAVKDVEIYKGGIPAEYGGRLSSLVDIRMKEGNSKKFSGTGGIGSISSRLTLEGPIVKDKSSFIVSGRRTYADLFLKLSPDKNVRSNVLYFYDLNAKMNYKINERNTVFLSGYFGRDVFSFGDVFGLSWGNATTTCRWNHLFSQKLFLNTTLLFSNYDYAFQINNGTQSFIWKSNFRNIGAKFDLNFFLNPNNELKIGSNTIFHTFSPARIEPKNENSVFETFKLDTKYAIEQAFYVSNNQKITSNFSIQYGIRYSMFENIGAGRVFNYAPDKPLDKKTITDTVTYSSLQPINFYHGLEPRIGARFQVTESSSIKSSYNRTMQYLQIASNSTAGLPIDRWIPADKYIRPQISDQVALGYFKNFYDNTFETSVEVYYKDMQNQIDFKDGAEILLNNNIETEVRAGKAWAYGAEFMVKKSRGQLTGWVSYTLSKVQRQIDGINGGVVYSPRYDRRHNISVVASYDLNKRLSFSTNWVYITGSAVSYPTGVYEVDGKRVPFYDPLNRNGDRMPAYHRLDVSATFKDLPFGFDLFRKKRKEHKVHFDLNLSVYNAYARKNAFTIQFRDVVNGDPSIDVNDPKITVITKEPKAVMTYLFSIIPAVTVNFKF